MATNGKTIRIFLTEGLPDGVLTAEIMNWTGKVTVGPKAQLAELARRDEVRRTGVYILAGGDPNNALQERVYIGEGDNVLTRLMRHYRDNQKDFWDRTAVVTSKDGNLTKAHVRYLESRLIGLATTAGRAVLDNGTAPPLPDLPEADRADMESFLEQVVMLMPVLGFTFAVQTPSSLPGPAITNNPAQTTTTPQQQPTIPTSESPTFTMTIGSITALAQQVGSEFIVLRDSHANKTASTSLSRRNTQIRDQLLANGRLVDNQQSNTLIFTSDVPFSSPSAAASVVAGNARNGRVEWKVRGTQQTYGDWQDSQLQQAGVALPSNTDGMVAILDDDDDEDDDEG